MSDPFVSAHALGQKIEIPPSNVVKMTQSNGILTAVALAQNWECTSVLFGDMPDEPCDSGIAFHVFQIEATGINRYSGDKGSVPWCNRTSNFTVVSYCRTG